MNWQLLIIIVYFLVTVLIGLNAGKKTKSSHAFTGVCLSVGAIVFASTGEWLGGTATTGVAEYGYNYGLSGAWYTIANGIGVMFLGLFFAKLFRSLEKGTVPGIIEHFFGENARTVSCLVMTTVMFAVGLSQMIAAGKLGENLIGINFTTSCIVFAIIFIIYTLAGGMNAVASTNILHLLVMYFGMILAVFLTLNRIGGLNEMNEGVKAVELELANQGEYISFYNMFTIGKSKVFSWVVASLLGACTAQAGLQPVLAAKNINDAKKSCIITAFAVAPFGLLTAFIGIGARVLVLKGQLLTKTGEIITNGKDALPSLMMQMHPIAGGLVLASILAAILSTVSPIILASGTMLTRDIYQKIIKPNASDQEILKISRMTTAVSGIICCIGAILLVNASAVLDIVYAAYSLRGAIFVVVLLGIYGKNVSNKGASYSMILTSVISVLWVFIKMNTGTYPIANWFSETYVAIITAYVSYVIFSFIFPNNDFKESLKEKHVNE